MIKLVIFDLDGVLVETKNAHFVALNTAIEQVAGSDYLISLDEHLKIYDGLKTNQKLELLTKTKGLSPSLYQDIWNKKQALTMQFLEEQIQPKDHIIKIVKDLQQENKKIVCCSNAVRRTILTILAKLQIIQHFDLIISNEDVINAKPHPEMYWLAMSKLGVLPEETLIIEDSPHGLLGATRSGATVLRVKNSEDLNYISIANKCNERRDMTIPKWQDRALNVLIPMAGAGSRFQQAGYTFPKPLIEVRNKPMIQVVVENLNVDAKFIFIAQKEHREAYNLDTMLQLIAPGCSVVEVDHLTEGAACTTLLAKEFINNNNPLIIANSDQYVEWNSNDFLYKMNEQDVDGGIITFEATHPKWSFAKVDENGFVTEVAEKRPISTSATVGIYFWKHGKDYVKYAEQMIQKNIRVNNEFYVCPVFNEAIQDGKKFKVYNIDKMWGLGTPEDLDVFLKNKV